MNYQFFSAYKTNRAINTKYLKSKNCMKLHSSIDAITSFESNELAMRNSMFSAGVYADLNPMYNEVCPPHHMEENLFQHHQSMAQTYPTQFSSPVDHQSQQMPIVPYGIPQNDHRSYSPGMSNSSNDVRNMGIPAHLSTDVDRHASPGPHSLNAASKPDMQWMVTTSHIDMRSVTPPNAVVAHSSMHQSPIIPHGQKPSLVTITHSGYANPSSSTTADGKPRLTKSGKPRGTPGRKRKVEDHDLAPEEAAKRRVRRERNKLAAAKCRNRRRELTDRLQGETDILEDHQGMLTQEIMALQQEKDHLEFILASHSPICKVLQDKTLNLMGNESPKEAQCMNSNDCIGLGDHHDHEADLLSAVDTINEMNDRQRLHATTVSVIQAGPSLTNSNTRPIGENIFGQQSNSVIVGNGSLMSNSFTSHNDCHRPDLGNRDHRRFPPALPDLDIGNHTGPLDTLNTPVCSLATPSNTSSVFTFPNTPCITSNSVTTSVMNSSNVAFNCGDFNAPHMSSGHGNYGVYNNHESCSAAHRRSSSSEPHTSPDSVKSPKLLSL